MLVIVCLSAGYISKVPRRLCFKDAPFALSLCISALIFMLVFVPGSVPDEFYHFSSAYKYSDILMGQSVSDTSISMRSDDAYLVDNVLSARVSRDSYRSVAENFSLLEQDASYGEKAVESDYSMTANVPQQRVPAALGIVLAKILGLGAVPLFYMGRLFNLAFSCFLIILAVRITPVGKSIFKIIALFPMALHLLASYSYDGPSLGFAFILTALILRAIYGEGVLGNKDLSAIVVTALLLAPCKVIYSLIAFAVFLIPSKRFASKRTEFLFKGGVVAAALAIVFLLRLSAFLSASGAASSGDTLDYRGAQTGRFYSMHDFITRPIMAVMLFLRSIDYFAENWIVTGVGGSLGWFQGEIMAPGYLNYAYLLLLCLSCVTVQNHEGGFPVRRGRSLPSSPSPLRSRPFCLLQRVGPLIPITSFWVFREGTSCQRFRCCC